MDGGERLAAAADVVEITQLVLNERQAVSRDWWGLAADCYDDDAAISLPDFQGHARDYLAARRLDRARGRHVRWSLASPAVQLNAPRAVATVDAVASRWASDDGVLFDLHALLVVRAERRFQAWHIVSLDAFLRRADIVSAPQDSWIRPGQQEPAPAATLDGLHRLGWVFMVDEEPEARARLEELLAWAGLAADREPAATDGAHGGGR